MFLYSYIFLNEIWLYFLSYSLLFRRSMQYQRQTIPSMLSYRLSLETSQVRLLVRHVRQRRLRYNIFALKAPSWLQLNGSSRTLYATPGLEDLESVQFDLVGSDHSASANIGVTLVISKEQGPEPGKPLLPQLAQAVLLLVPLQFLCTLVGIFGSLSIGKPSSTRMTARSTTRRPQITLLFLLGLVSIQLH